MFQQIKNFYHLLQSLVAMTWFGFPQKKLKVIGVTGTDGKTTTTHLIYHILKSAGHKVSMISSVYAVIGGQEFDTGFHVTTPDVFPLYRFLKRSVDHGDEYFVLETTSHALFQNRVWGIFYEIGVVTNVTHEHLDFHKTYNNYVEAKSRLLIRSKTAVINEEDGSYDQILSFLKKSHESHKSHVTYGLHFKFENQFKNLSEFNKYNFAAAYTVTKIAGVSDEKIQNGMKTFKLPPGRMEVVYAGNFKVIIDFAHTPNAISQALSSIKHNFQKKGGRIIHVFGAAGRRDQSKRPLMGISSAKYSQVAILTEEDYRDEDPQRICEEIASGLEKNGFKKIDRKHLDYGSQKVYTVEIDREKAIALALSIANKNDIVVATGKAVEKSLARGNKEYPWDEKKTVEKYLSKIYQ